MSVSTDSVPEFVSPFDIIPAALVGPEDRAAESDIATEINQRRAQLENPELLRRLRSL